MKKTVLSLLLASLLFTGCSTETDHSFTDQHESFQASSADMTGTHSNDITRLKICEEPNLNETSLYFDSSFQTISQADLHETYFSQNSGNSCILLEPFRITAFYKIDETPLKFQDPESAFIIKDSKQSLEISQSFSQITDDIHFDEGYIAFYFYPAVSENDYHSGKIISAKIRTGKKTYCDGIYELRWSKDIDPAS